MTIGPPGCPCGAIVAEVESRVELDGGDEARCYNVPGHAVPPLRLLAPLNSGVVSQSRFEAAGLARPVMAAAKSPLSQGAAAARRPLA
jgi:hypothetical protein